MQRNVIQSTVTRSTCTLKFAIRETLELLSGPMELVPGLTWKYHSYKVGVMLKIFASPAQKRSNFL